ncbi:hypothetical protein B8T70_09095 [Flavobacterium sp. AJR]|nr:hypothetical protein OA93_17790 [Flavobacterium sp. KMS]OUL62595.1 hypothetical protein B8T70_09095 [Flavobacterium sp. AJR]
MEWSFSEKEALIMSLRSTIIGLISFFDGLPFFLVFPIILMLLLYDYGFKRKIHKSYLVSLLISHLSLYLLLWSRNEHKHYFSTRLLSELEAPEINVLFFLQYQV